MRLRVEFRQASKATYNVYKETHPNSKMSYKTYCDIIYGFNEGVRDYLFETGNKFRLPQGFGYFAVTKYKVDISRLAEPSKEGKKKFIPVDWKKTKELGKYVYHLNFHTNGYKFKLKWFIPTTRFAFSRIWFFRPSRVTSRMLKHYITLPGYKDKYLSWKNI